MTDKNAKYSKVLQFFAKFHRYFLTETGFWFLSHLKLFRFKVIDVSALLGLELFVALLLSEAAAFLYICAGKLLYFAWVCKEQKPHEFSTRYQSAIPFQAHYYYSVPLANFCFLN